MKKGLAEVIVLHDKNAPVSGLEKTVLKCADEFLVSLRNTEAVNTDDLQIRFSCAVFGGEYDLFVESVPIADVKLTNKKFTVKGTRDFFDSAANLITQKGIAYSNQPENEHPENVILILVAFGRDNASKNFTYSQVADMIRHQTEVYKWKFFCVTGDSFVSEQLGIPEEFIVLFDSKEEGFFAKALEELAARIINLLAPPPAPPDEPDESAETDDEAGEAD